MKIFPPMAFINISIKIFLSIFVLFATLPKFSSATPRILALVKQAPLVLNDHKGTLLKGNVNVNLIWYGVFTSTQRSIIIDFFHSLSPKHHRGPPPLSVASWWSTTNNYKGGSSIINIGEQVFDKKYSIGKSLTDAHIAALASKAAGHVTGVNIVLTASDVAVEDFCMNRCGSHGYIRSKNGKKYAYAWVGNSVSQCPGQCAWPFHKPIQGPQMPLLVAPNGDIGVDGMVINLATVLAGAVTNPFDNGYFQGPATAPLEAVTACTGIFGSGAFPGYPGKVLVDKRTRASYNAKGENSRKYLLPAMWDPATLKCKTPL